MRARTGGGGVNRQGGGRYDLVPVAAVHPRPTSARTGPLAASAPTRLVAALFVVLALALVGAAPASARSAQDPGVTTTFPVEVSSSTTTPVTTVVPTTAAVVTTDVEDPEASTGAGSTRVADENRKIWAVVAGLVLVAVALSLLTIRYWRKTRPVPPTTGLMMPTDAALAVALASNTAEEPAPGPDPDVKAEPEPEPDPEPKPDPDPVLVPTGLVEVDGAHDLHDDAVYDAANDTAPVPVVEAPPAEPASARRAVAGADHAAADEAWEPRGTAEHERVVVAPAARANRLTPEQRAALFAQRTPPQA